MTDTIMTDGFKTTISFSLNLNVKFDEKEVQPPGVSGGGEIDTTTQNNAVWRTKAPKKLKTLTEASLVVAYAPAAYPEIVQMTSTNQLITITFPDDATLAFWGWIDEFTPGNNVEGEQPTAEVTIMCSNMDNNSVERGPVYAESAA